jgi:hypothetical protein
LARVSNHEAFVAHPSRRRAKSAAPQDEGSLWRERFQNNSGLRVRAKSASRNDNQRFSRKIHSLAKIIFITFVDAMFTTFVEPPFTNAFDDLSQMQTPLACRARAAVINPAATLIEY